jgi:hypothetical protein
MPDGDGLDFDVTIPSDQSSVKNGAAEIRALRAVLKNWSGNGTASGSIFSAQTEVATLADNTVASSKLQSPSPIVASVDTLPTIASTASTYSAISFNNKGQAVQAKKATLDDLSLLSGNSKLSVANLAPSSTAKQFLRTNSAGTASEWVSSATVSRWDTSQGTTFMETVNDNRTGGNSGLDITDWYGATWDGTRFAICGAGGLKVTRDFYRHRAEPTITGANTATNIVRDVVSSLTPAAGLPKAVAVGLSGSTSLLVTKYNGLRADANTPPNYPWRIRSFTVGGTVQLNAVATSNSSYVAVGNSGTIYHFGANTLPDTAAAVTPSVISSSGGDLHDVAFGNGYYVAVGQAGNVKIFTDLAGATVTSLTVSTVTLRGVVYAAHLSKWILVGESGVVCVSSEANPTLASWTVTTPGGAGFNFTSVDCGNDVLVAVGQNGNIWNSPDGVAWTNVSGNIVRPESNTNLPIFSVSALSANYNRVVFCSGTWVIVAPGYVLVGGDLPISYYDETANSAYVSTAGVGYALPHTLGASPHLVSAALVNIDPTSGYVAGDLVPLFDRGLDASDVTYNNSYVTWLNYNLGTSTITTRFQIRPKTYVWNLSVGSPPIGLVLGLSNAAYIDASCWRIRLSAVVFK